MNVFTCLIDSSGGPVPDTSRHEAEGFPRSRRLPFKWHLHDSLTVLTCGSDAGATLVARCGQTVVVGSVRLDNRCEIERLVDFAPRSLSDLELLGYALDPDHPDRVAGIQGEFSFLLWDCRAHRGFAACDALGTRRLYHTTAKGALVFTSRADAFFREERYEVQYLAERVAGCLPSPGLTPFDGMKSVDGGTVVTIRGNRLSSQRYWSPFSVPDETPWRGSARDAVAACRALLSESVLLRLRSQPNAWAHLSGGMDSSSVVSLAQWLTQDGRLPHGLAGTVTYYEPDGLAGDERRYAEEVSRRWAVRNEAIPTSSPSMGSYLEIPATEEPYTSILAAQQDAKLCDLLEEHGGRVLLTGAGGDMLFSGTMFFFADWLIHGQFLRAAREMLRRATIGRASFWELAYRNALLPLLPGGLRRYLAQDEQTVPPWVNQSLVRQYGLKERLVAPGLYSGRLGHKYADAVAAGIENIRYGLTAGLADERLDVRHPYYYRPLVEFALSLPPELCVQPHARKWVLREAMIGILPEMVRMRVGKGSYNASIVRSVQVEAEQAQAMVKDSMLADLGVIDRRGVHAAFAAVAQDRADRYWASGGLAVAVTLEAWLQARQNGRWSCGKAMMYG